jgi:hypothetical protein
MKLLNKIWAKLTIKDKMQQEKKLATINKEPWVAVVNVEFTDPEDSTSGAFELDWNEFFVSMLTDQGYSGRTDSEVIDQWFRDVCRGVISEDFDQQT